MKSRGAHQTFKRVVALLALLLAVAWVPLTSHELLEAAALIHQDAGHDDDGAAHDAADGAVFLQSGGIILKAPTLLSLEWSIAFVELCGASVYVVCAAASYLRRPNESPPGFIRPWQFDLRQALPSRAPSFAI